MADLGNFLSVLKVNRIFAFTPGIVGNAVTGSGATPFAPILVSSLRGVFLEQITADSLGVWVWYDVRPGTYWLYEAGIVSDDFDMRSWEVVVADNGAFVVTPFEPEDSGGPDPEVVTHPPSPLYGE